MQLLPEQSALTPTFWSQAHGTVRVAHCLDFTCTGRQM
jgi:hypothetical protein